MKAVYLFLVAVFLVGCIAPQIAMQNVAVDDVFESWDKANLYMIDNENYIASKSNDYIISSESFHHDIRMVKRLDSIEISVTANPPIGDTSGWYKNKMKNEANEILDKIILSVK